MQYVNRTGTDATGVFSEYEPLTSVLVHRPGNELRFTPDMAKEVLWDDIVDLETTQRQHDAFKQALLYNGTNVLEVISLLTDVLTNAGLHHEVIRELAWDKKWQPSRVDEAVFTEKKVDAMFNKFTARDLAQFIISGFWGKDMYLKPIPNLMFIRDPAAVAGNTMFLSRFRWKGRMREELIMSLLTKHPIFGDLGLTSCCITDETTPEDHDRANKHRARDIERRKKQWNTFEGGDLIVVNERLVLVGCSERTSEPTIGALARKLYEQNIDLGVVLMSSSRTWMHLDTVLAFVSPEHYLAYPHMFNLGKQYATISVLRSHEGVVDWDSRHQELGLTDILKDYSYTGKPIFIGGNDPVDQKREQYTEATNVITVRPGAFIMYRRNHQTIRTLRELNFLVTKDYNEFAEMLTTDQSLVLLIEDSELVRGRGGPHCMTMPLARTIAS